MTITASEAHATVEAATAAGKQVTVTIAGASDGPYAFTGTARFLSAKPAHLTLFGVLVPAGGYAIDRDSAHWGADPPTIRGTPVPGGNVATCMHFSTDQLLTLVQADVDADATLGTWLNPSSGAREPDPEWQRGRRTTALSRPPVNKQGASRPLPSWPTVWPTGPTVWPPAPA